MLQVIKTCTKEVMSDNSWLEAPEKVVLEIFELRDMQISEALLFVNLLNWGRAQVKNEADLRAKIDSCLKLIRFCTMDNSEFSGLCCKPIPLTTEEKYKIFLSISQQSAQHLPEGFSEEIWPRCIEESLIYDWMHLKSNENLAVDNQTAPFFMTVAVHPEHYLTGLKLHSLSNINAGEMVHLTCDVYSSEYPSLYIASATFREIVQANRIGEVVFDRPVLMKQGISYAIKLTYEQSNSVLTSVFPTDRTYSWSKESDEDNDDKDAIVVFALDDEPLAPILDICGLVLAKKSG